MERLFHWFYCLKIPNAIYFLLLCSFLFFLLHEKLQDRKWWRWLCMGLLAALMVAILYTTVGSRGDGSGYQVHLIPFHTYREVMNGGNPELYRSNFMNAALFYPAGLLLVSLLPKKWPGWGRCLLVVFILGAMSAGIEYLQYRYALGHVEIDDVIHNTAGAAGGCLAAILIPEVLSWIQKRIFVKTEET